MDSGAVLRDPEMERLRQYGESTLRDFRPSCMDHKTASIIGQPTPVESNCLTVWIQS